MKARVYGDSMLPTLKYGALIEITQIKSCMYDDIKIGDIVSYWSKGFNRKGEPRFWHMANVIHRVVGKTPTYALIKGDNREYMERVSYSKINGKVKVLH